jgi:hypothetical protein
MIASYPDRRFQFWEYKVSHGSLLVRSPKNLENVVNVDLMFAGVEFVSIPRHMNGIALEEGTSVDIEAVSKMHGQRERSSNVFTIVSEGYRYFVVAAGCKVAETTMDIFDTPFS